MTPAPLLLLALALSSSAAAAGAASVRGGGVTSGTGPALRPSPVSFTPPTPVLDTPYEETLSTRYPFLGSFPTASVPTGWTQLGCGNASSVAVAGVAGAPTTPRPLLLCPSSSSSPPPPTPVFDVLSSTFVPVTGASMSGDGQWVFAQPMSGGASSASDGTWPAPLVAVGPTSVLLLTCSWSGAAPTCAATTLVAAHSLSVVSFAGVYPSLTAASGAYWTLLISGVNATLSWDFLPASPSNPSLSPVLALADFTSAAAVSPAAGVLVLGNSSTIAFRNASSGALLRWEWVTYVPTASGGVVDDVITALAFDDAAAVAGVNGPVLYIGNPSCLNIAVLGAPGTGMAPEDLFPVPVFDRIGAPEGLPYGNISSLAVDMSAPPGRATGPGQPRRLFIGTAAGIALFDPAAQAEWGGGSAVARAALLRRRRRRGSNTGAAAPATVPFAQRWRWFAGGRWLPVTAADPFGSSTLALLPYPTSPANPCAAAGGPFPVGPCGGGLLALTVHGLADLQSFAYTLEAKAALLESTLPSFNLSGTGLIAGCYAPAFGRLADCATQPDDNSGLWTSLPVATFAAKFVATGDPADAQRSRDWLAGLYALNNVTGIQGLFARCALPPGVPPPPSGCCPWHNSTSLPGWTWKGDTSSDEVAGHVMAYAVTQSWLLPAAGGAFAGLSAATGLHLARYVVGNNLTLVDVTGLPTTWGHWEPAFINGDRDWSDERGLNPVEIIAMLTTALAGVSVPGSGGGANDTAVLTKALEALLAPDVAYGENMVNAKIIVPDDDNYSDDELLFFSYLPLLLSTEGAAQGSPQALSRDYALLSLARSWSEIAFTRPSLWNVIAMAMFGAAAGGGGGKGGAAAAAQAAVASRLVSGRGFDNDDDGGAALPGPQLPDSDAALADTLWNLRTWPLESLDWPVLNSVRLDVPVDPEVDRDLHSNTQSLGILPGNERVFPRWNGNPRTLDGGSGTSATDPAAFLMPYWLARRYGFLSNATATAAD
jgi:hypothetical protein